jgi:phosphate transport system protein
MTSERLEHMKGIFRGDLQKLREMLLMMSSIADRNLTMALSGLVDRDDKKAETVLSEDSQLDQLEIDIDEQVVTFMATHGPIATACRLMLATSKMSSNLETIGDQAVTIARRTKILNAEPQLKPLIDIPRMARIAIEMMRASTDAFVDFQPDKALEVIKRDKEVDEINRQLERELTSYMVENPNTITRALNLMLVARSIERAADCAKSNAEEVYFLLTAKDIRHDKSIREG